MVIFFWSSVLLVSYTYLGYGLLVWIWAGCKRKQAPATANKFEPAVTLIVPAYNEADILEAKIRNCYSLDYPIDKLSILFITDGSTDDFEKILAKYPKIHHLHLPERKGKAMAENRAIEYVSTAYTVFTDCNTLLNSEAIREMIQHYADPLVGAVSGEKRVLRDSYSADSGEGIYWKYESFLKQCDSIIYSLMGAAGELISFRTELFKPLEPDTILDDFVQSMRIVQAGFRVIYEPKAYAMELPSPSLGEEMERKIRISAGGWQAMVRLRSLLNPFPQPIVTWLYVSHRVLRWSITPVLMVLLLPLNAYLALHGSTIYSVIWYLQIFFYATAIIGWVISLRRGQLGMLLIPMYFTMMNVAVFLGFRRYFSNGQSAAWEKSSRLINN